MLADWPGASYEGVAIQSGYEPGVVMESKSRSGVLVSRMMGILVGVGGLAGGASGVLLAGCDGEAAAGTLEVRAYGGVYVEDKIPATAFADGWAVDFSRFLVAISAVTSTTGGEPEVSDGKIYIVDLVLPSGKRGHVLFASEVPGGRYGSTSFTIAPATAGAVAANVSSDDVGFMIGGGLSMYIEGTAVKEGVTKRFAWRIQTTTRYANCESDATVDGNSKAIELTVRGERIFLDAGGGAGALMKFDLFAGADIDANNVLTLDELAGVDVTAQATYGGLAGVTNLRQYLEAMTRTFGAVDGDGVCTVE